MINHFHINMLITVINTIVLTVSAGAQKYIVLKYVPISAVLRQFSEKTADCVKVKGNLVNACSWKG